MQIRCTLNGGSAEVSEDQAERLIASGFWEHIDAPAKPVKPKRIRRTRAQIEADNAKAAAEAAKVQE